MASYFTNEHQLNRAQRRRLEATIPAVDRITAADAAFFERWPQRHHRLRPMSAIEREQMAAVGEIGPLEPGERWAVVIKAIAPGARMRRPFRCRRETDLLDAPEAVAAATWLQAAANDPQNAIIEERVRTVLRAQQKGAE